MFAEFYPPQGLLEWVLLCSIALYALGIVWFLSGTRHRRACCAVQPFASIVIAARDEEQRIRSCLLSLLAQDYPSERFEVIVVDDGSRDDTAHIVEKLCVQDARLRLLRRSPGGSKKAALAQAIEQARGEIILTTDADCQVGAQWLRGMLAHFDANVGVVIGFSQIGAPGQVMSWRGAYEAVDFLQLMTCIWGSTGRGHAMAASGQNLAYRRAAYMEVGGFSRIMQRASGDDVLLVQMVRNLTSWRIAFCTDPGTFAVHPPTASWGKLLLQRSRWASNVPVLVRLDPLFFSYMVITYALSLFALMAPLLWAAGQLRLEWALLGLLVKFGGEAGLFARSLALSHRGELLRYWPLWALLQPLHVVLVGGLGPLGIFSWKGKRHRWGRQRAHGAERCITD